MTGRNVVRRGVSALLAGAAVGFAALASAPQPARATSPTSVNLAGTFSITSGVCSTAPSTAPTGSYFFMTNASGFVGSFSSPCTAQSGDYTPLQQGSQGMVSARYQLDPNPTFDGAGNSRANAIITPASFFGTNFSLATTCADQQNAPTATGSCPGSGSTFPTPSLTAETPGTGGCPASATQDCVYGTLDAIGATWNGNPGGTCLGPPPGNGCYDQGAAVASNLTTVTCPGGGTGCSLRGTYNPVTNAYTLDWTSLIVGGGFNGFTGHYHFVGTFSSATPPPTPTPSPTSTPAPTATPRPTSRATPTPAGRTVSRFDGALGVAAGQCGSGTPSGSYFEMTKGGGPIKNTSPNCSDGTYTLLTQGSTGLQLNSFQPPPDPAFDPNGNGRAGAITKPVAFFGVDFALATAGQDEQNNPSGSAKFPAPSAVLNGTTMTADLSSLLALWNGTAAKTCATGSPPGDGCYDQGSAAATGTYNQSTRHYTLSWSATIHGGAFNGAAGNWHLEGVFSGRIVQVTVPVTGSQAALPASGNLAVLGWALTVGGVLACLLAWALVWGRQRGPAV